MVRLDESDTDAVVVNSTAPSGEVAEAVTSLHEVSPRPMVVAYDDTSCGEATGADLGIVRPLDVDDVIAPLLVFLADNAPEDGEGERLQDAAGGAA